MPLIGSPLPLFPPQAEMAIYTITFTRRVWPLFLVIDISI